MRLTPLDIQNHRFSPRFRGVDESEVESFLKLVAEDYESLQRERDKLDERVKSIEARCEELSGNEKMLQDTLVTAQALSEDLKATAIRECESRVAEAELQAEKIMQASHRRAARLADDVRELKGMRTRLGEAIRANIETHLALLESLVDDAGEEIDNVAYLSPTGSSPGDV